MERVIAEVRTLVEAGYREVVISGINLGRWGRDLEEVVGRQSLVLASRTLSPAFQPQPASTERPTTNDQRLESLIRAILDQTSLEKLRISSVEPMDWSDELIGSGGGVRADRQACARAHAVGKRCRVAAHASQVPAVALPGEDPEDSSGHANCGDRRRCDGGISGRDGSGVRRDAAHDRRAAVYLSACLHLFGASGNAGSGAAWSRFRSQWLGKETACCAKLHPRRKRRLCGRWWGRWSRRSHCNRAEAEFTEALTDNYLKMKIPGHHEANRWMDVKVEGVNGEMLLGSAAVEARADRAEPRRPLARVTQECTDSEQTH